MRELIATGMNRRMQLLEFLEAENSWVASSSLAEKLGCSLKTVIGDVQYLMDRWPDYLTIETSRQKGIRLISPASNSLRDIYLEVLKESDAFSLIESLFFEADKELEAWQQQYFLSSSTMYRMLKQIGNSLGKRAVKINRSPVYLYSQDERTVRFFYTAYFIEAYGVHQWPFQLSQTRLLALSQTLSRKLALGMDDSQLINFSYLLAISFRRMQQGFSLSTVAELANEGLSVEAVLEEHADEFRELVAAAGWQLAPGWQNDLMQTAFFYLFNWQSKTEYNDLMKALKNFLYTVRQALQIDLEPACEKSIVDYMAYLYTKQKIYPYPEYILYNRSHYASEPIKRSYLAFTVVTEKALRSLERQTNFPWTANQDDILHWMMVRWNHLPTLLDGLRKQVSLFVVSDLGEKHGLLIKELIERNFGDKVQVDTSHVSFFQFNDTKLEKILKYDICVANYMIPELPKDRLIVVDDIPSFRNWSDLRRMIEFRRLLLPESLPYIQTGKI